MASNVPSLEECRTFLAAPHTSSGGQSKSVMDHVSQLLLKVLETKPNNSFDVFEEVSSCIKNEWKEPGYVPGPAATVEWAQGVETLTGPPKPLAEGEEEVDEGDGNPDCKVANVVQEAALLEAAAVGSGLTRKNAVRLYLGMKKLAAKDANLVSVRLFGVVFGTKRDYLVCEGMYGDDYTEPEEEPADGEEEQKQAPALPAEPIGAGANKYVYFVTESAGCVDKWIRLPKCRPECIMVARKIKKLFTGDLEAAVTSYPPFPGVEKDYLRAQIGRIAAGATVCVKGMFVKDPEDEESLAVVPNEPNWEEGNPGYVPPKAVELSSSTSWVHHPSYPSLLSKMGRCVEPEREEDEDEGAKLPPQEKGAELLGCVAADQRVSRMAPAWTARSATPALGEHSASVLRSTRWPGATCVAQDNVFVNVYVGSGHKHNEGGFQVFAPPKLSSECVVEKEQFDEMVELPPPPEEEEEE